MHLRPPDALEPAVGAERTTAFWPTALPCSAPPIRARSCRYRQPGRSGAPAGTAGRQPGAPVCPRVDLPTAGAERVDLVGIARAGDVDRPASGGPTARPDGWGSGKKVMPAYPAGRREADQQMLVFAGDEQRDAEPLENVPPAAARALLEQPGVDGAASPPVLATVRSLASLPCGAPTWSARRDVAAAPLSRRGRGAVEGGMRPRYICIADRRLVVLCPAAASSKIGTSITGYSSRRHSPLNSEVDQVVVARQL